MSRHLNDDFSNLKSFLKDYKTDFPDEFWTILSEQHKRLYGYLSFIAEINYLKSNSVQEEPDLSEKQIQFISESCSDVGNAIFIMSHGAYKASKMMLRSSIETFIKGFVLDEIDDIDIEKSVYNIFSKTSDLDFFRDGVNKTLLSDIKSTYAKLCEDVHTANVINMQSMNALNYFPSFDAPKATILKRFLSGLVADYLCLMCIKYNKYFHKMHHTNKQIIIININKSYRSYIMSLQS